MRVLLLLAMLGLAAAQCQSKFFSLPHLDVANGTAKAYLEYPETDAGAWALEFCQLYYNQSATAGTYKLATLDLTKRLPEVWTADPSGNLSICEGVGCRIFGTIECVPKGQSPCPADAAGNIGNGNSGVGNVGNNNSGSYNMCNGCSGSSNVGDDNAGSNNLGWSNSGSNTVGSFNAGSNVICWNTTNTNVPFEACPPALWGPFVPQ